MPIVDDLNVGCREDHEPDIRRSAIVEAPGLAVMHDRVADRPLAMLDEAAVTPAPGDAKSSGNGDGLPSRVNAARSRLLRSKICLPAPSAIYPVSRLQTEATIAHQPTDPSARDNSSMTVRNSGEVSSGPP